jgi:hypothetical protein
MPANLKGLNIVQPQQAPSDSQDLLSGQSFPDISAQLDLWTNLTFDMDENSPSRNDEDKLHPKHTEGNENEAKLHASINSENADVITAANLGSNVQRNQSQPNAASQLQSFDLNALLSGIGFDPYANLAHQPNTSTITPSLAQLLALHSQNQIQGGIPSPFSQYAVPSSTTYNPIASPPPHQTSLAPASSPPAVPVTAFATSEEPQAKRSRTRKTSVSSSDTLSPDVPSVTLAAAEDKRRRNTAASARFRLKKKEREAALEGKAKELETRVSELERECEGLRRENGWLKGLVVGVTGAAQAPGVTSPPSPLTSVQLASLTSATSSPRRNRDDSNN